MVSPLAVRLLMHAYPNPFDKKSAMEVYSNATSLRRTIHYFKSAGFLECRKNSDKTMTYYFTPTGVLFVELILRLPDVPDKFKRKAQLTKFEVDV